MLSWNSVSDAVFCTYVCVCVRIYSAMVLVQNAKMYIVCTVEFDCVLCITAVESLAILVGLLPNWWLGG